MQDGEHIGIVQHIRAHERNTALANVELESAEAR